jgi:Putative adhesin
MPDMTTTTNGNAVLEHAIGARGELNVRTHSGEITVTATDADVARVRDLDGRALGDRFAIEESDGRLSVRAKDGFVLDLGRGRGRGTVRLAVEVPRQATVSFETASADVRATGLAGEQRYRTASGDLTLLDASGPIALDAVSGDVRIDAIGPVELSGRLVSGDLRIRGGELRTAALATTSGDLHLESVLTGPGPYSVQTVSGDAIVHAATDALRIDAQTVAGDLIGEPVVSSDRGPGRRRAVIGIGPQAFSFRSISGDLQLISRPASGRVDSHALPEPPAPPMPPAAPQPVPDAGPTAEDPRLAILRDLEAGAIDVATATERLAALEDGTDD